jgi:hypothetical protein
MPSGAALLELISLSKWMKMTAKKFYDGKMSPQGLDVLECCRAG